MRREIQQVGKHSLIYGAGQVLQRLVGFLLIPLYTTYFSTNEYGILEILITTGNLLITILGMGMISAMFRSYYRDPDKARQQSVAKTALSVYFLVSTAVCALLFLAIRPLSGLLLDDVSYWPLLGLTLGFVILSNFNSVPFSILRAQGKSLQYVGYSLAQFTVNVVTAVTLVVVFRHGVRGSLEGIVFGHVAVLALFVPFIIRTMKSKFSWTELKEMLSFGLPLVPAMIASIVLTASDRYFLRAFSTFDELGVYGLGYKFGFMIQILIVTPFTLSYGPMMWSMASRPDAKAFYARVLTYFTMVSLYLALALSMLSPEIIRIMARKQAFWRASNFVPLVALSYVFYGMYTQFAIGLSLRDKTRYFPLVVGFAAVANIVLNFLLIPSYGGMGAAVSTVVSYLVLTVVVYLVSQRLYPIHYEWRRLIKVAGISGFVYAASWFLPSVATGITLGAKLILLLIFPLLLYILGVFNPSELERARAFAKSGMKSWKHWTGSSR